MSEGKRSTFIPQHLRMYAALHFFTTDSFYRDIGQDFTALVSKTFICRSIHKTAGILDQKLMPKWIKFPTSSQYEPIKQKQVNKSRNCFPERITMYIDNFTDFMKKLDCTHVRIKKPKPA